MAESTRQPVGTQIPKASLNQAEQYARAIWESTRGRPVPRQGIAGALGHSPSSGTFKTKLALLRYFGLVEDLDNKLGLTDVGKTVVRHDIDTTNARQKAFFAAPHYEDLFHSYREAGPPEESALASSLHFEFGLPEDSAQKAATAFLESAALAKVFEGTGTVSDETGHHDEDIRLGTPSDDHTQQENQVDLGERKAPPLPLLPERDRPPAPALAISLDLTGRPLEEIRAILSDLGFLDKK